MRTTYKKQVLWVVIVTVALLVGAASVFGFSFGKYEKVNANGSTVSIPVSKVSDGKAHFFRFDNSGKHIDFFVVKAFDGSFKTAFDACDVCYKSRKGYEQKDDVMVCKNCNQKFAIKLIGPSSIRGCNPSYLPHQQVGNNISINLTDIKTGARFF